MTDTSAVSGLYSQSPFAALWERLESLPRKQRIIAETILATPETIAFGSVREVAKITGVNAATIVRFAQSLEFTGYQAMQYSVRRAYLQHAGLQAPYDLDASEPGNIAEPLAAQQLANVRLAHDEFAKIDSAALVERLMASRRILVCAEGGIENVAMLLARMLCQIGLHGEFFRTGNVDHVLALQNITSEDSVIAVSGWLTFRGTAVAMTKAQNVAGTTAAIVGNAASPLATICDFVLFAPARANSLTYSLVATVAIAEELVSRIAARRPEEAHEAAQALHDSYLEENLIAPMTSPTRARNERS
jgi:DNA-binding MurR/RpiR family transcriptional regulator